MGAGCIAGDLVSSGGGRSADVAAGGSTVDASGGFPDGSTFTGVAALENALLQRPELFAGALSEKLLIFALGRGVETYDAPAIRQIIRHAQADNFRFSSLILGIVNSTPFQMRKTP